MSRVAYLTFGVLAYLLFFGTFLYLIAFVGNFPGVPRSVDRGPEVAPLLAVLVDVALISLFGLQHSIMARQGFKRAWTKIVPQAVERSAYVLASSAVLWLLYYFWLPIDMTIWHVENPAIAGVLWAVFALGWLVVLLSTFLISHFELFGLKQVFQNLHGGNVIEPQLHQPLFYKLVRHPLYAGFLLAFWSIPVITAGHLLFAVAMTAYVLIAIRYEERDLVAVFGQGYRDYRARVGMLIPGIGKGHGD